MLGDSVVLFICKLKHFSSVLQLHLTITTPWANSADDKLVIHVFCDIFLIFDRKQDFTFHGNCLHFMKCQILFSGKNVSKCRQKILPSLSVKQCIEMNITLEPHCDAYLHIQQKNYGGTFGTIFSYFFINVVGIH